MSDINKVIITGRVTRDSELRTTPNGTAVADVSVVSNRVWSKAGDRQEESTFVDVTLWGKQAESLTPYLTKGRHVMVEARLKLNSWETDEGVKRNKLTLVAENVNLTPNNANPSQSKQETASASSKDDDAPF
jgi:single-strand DNA-binding protein|tara:strand:- start:6444 stop:6839 length:396 start_codon:yes stop_codon:yes gene_type:complete